MADFGIRVSVRGLQALQRANIQMLEAVNPRGGLGRGIRDAGVFMLRYARAITHIQTGTLAASHRMDFAQGGVESFFGAVRFRTDVFARIYIDSSAKNPFTGQRPYIYGSAEHAKGGSHRFYERAVDEAGDTAIAIVNNALMRALPKGGGRSSGLGLLFGIVGLGNRLL